MDSNQYAFIRMLAFLPVDLLKEQSFEISFSPFLASLSSPKSGYLFHRVPHLLHTHHLSLDFPVSYSTCLRRMSLSAAIV